MLALYFFALYLALFYWLFVEQRTTPSSAPVPAPMVAPATRPAAPKAMPSHQAIVAIPVDQPPLRKHVSEPAKLPPIRTLKKLAVGRGIPGYSTMTQAQLYQALKERACF